MNLGRVVGTVVAERTYPGLRGVKLMIVEPLDHRMQQSAAPVVAVDTVMAGTGDTVYFVSSREAALALEPWFVPVDHAIVGIVDSVHPEHDSDAPR